MTAPISKYDVLRFISQPPVVHEALLPVIWTMVFQPSLQRK